GIFIVLSGFATTDLSVRFCDACQGGGAYGKTPRRGVAFSPLSLAFVMLTVTLSAYPPSARRRLMTERSERMSEEAENHQNVQ
ncbi:hypothetical protein ACMWP3_23845, partial [Escherichia coli]|uniref:hypothetical protein n=4 Tax=Enterobacteriaceae TaxID=543 RepID=UPI0039E07990